MKDVYYTDEGGFIECTGLQAIGQRILSLLFAEPDTFRSVSGNMVPYINSYYGDAEKLQSILQMEATDIANYVSRSLPRSVKVTIKDINTDEDGRASVCVEVSSAEDTANIVREIRWA